MDEVTKEALHAVNMVFFLGLPTFVFLWVMADILPVVWVILRDLPLVIRARIEHRRAMQRAVDAAVKRGGLPKGTKLRWK